MMAPLSFLVSAAALSVLPAVVGLGVSQAAHLLIVFLLRVMHVGHSHVSALRLAASWKKLVIGAAKVALPVVVAEAVVVSAAWAAAS